MISVIIPIYKVEAYLEKCIESVRNQTYKDMEIILVDDGSPDGCGKICDRYQEQDKRIKVLHKENGGLSDARNKGLDIAAGEYILFVDSDDYIHPQMLEILYRNMQEADADISVCGFKETGEKEEPVFDAIAETDNTEVFEGRDVMNQLQHKNTLTVVAWNKLYKAKLWKDIRYPKGKIHEDEFLIHLLLHECHRIVYTGTALYYYVQRAGSIMGQLKCGSVADGLEAYEGRLAFLEKHGYAQMALWTKLHILHYICVYYEKLRDCREAAALLDTFRSRFAALYREKDVKETLTEKLRREYKYFVISPQLYYNSRKRAEKRKERIQSGKRWLKKLFRK